MCRLTLAWVTSETSTKQLECRLILMRSSFTGLDPISSHWSHRSGVRSRPPLSVVPRQLLSGVNRIFPSPSPTLSAPLSNQLSSRVPLPPPATPRFQVQKPFVWFRAKTDKGIVCLAGHPYSATYILITISIDVHVYIFAKCITSSAFSIHEKGTILKKKMHVIYSQCMRISWLTNKHFHWTLYAFTKPSSRFGCDQCFIFKRILSS